MNTLLLVSKVTPQGHFLLDGDAAVARTFARNPNATYSDQHAEAGAYAHRIALCVGALQGKTNEQLESFAGRLDAATSVELWSDYCDQKQEIAELKTTLDEMERLKEFASTIREFVEKYPHDTELHDVAVAALSKLEVSS